ncbi:MAG: peptidylprolyl isomerase [Lentisphaeria bacterium]|nr:peptidylprolyl isomerase [Lentisphaeria bacterium]NQZ68339.1 peptidylprolyl isomerase [Lentisphaeria bacterium]
MTLKVNNQEISDEILEQEYQQILQQQQTNPELQQMSPADLYSVARENVIDHFLLRQSAEETFNDVPEKDIEKRYGELLERFDGEANFLEKNRLTESDIGHVKETLRKDFQLSKLIWQITDEIEKPDDDTVYKEYTTNITHFGTPDKLDASHIVKHTNKGESPEQAMAKIKEAEAKLKAGDDFLKVAEEYSDCPSKGGSLGEFPRGQMVQRFDDVVFKLKANQVSEIFETEFGYHIAKVHKVTPGQITPFGEIKERLAEGLYNQAKAKVVDAYIADIRKDASIEES